MEWLAERTRSMSMLDNEALPAGRFVFALGILAVLAGLVTTIPESLLAHIDKPVQSLLLSQQSETLDLIMVAMTLLGDFHFTTSLMLVIVALLLTARRYWLGAHALAVFISTKLTVAIIKTLVVRARPLELYPGGDVYSFPSGHAASAAVLLGVGGVLILARRRGGVASFPVRRYLVIALLSVIVLGVAISRVYLLAHWPSDVIASLALSLVFISAFAWQVHRSSPLPRWLGSAVAGSLFAGYVAYTMLSLSSEFDRYRAAGSFLID